MAKKPNKSVTPNPALPGPIVPRMLNAAQAAAYLGVGTFAVRGLHWSGALRGVFIGRKLLWDKQDLDAYITRLKATA